MYLEIISKYCKLYLQIISKYSVLYLENISKYSIQIYNLHIYCFPLNFPHISPKPYPIEKNSYM